MSRSQEFYMGTSSGSRRELVSATNGFGLRAPVDEESERKRRSEETAYSLRAKRVKTEQDIEEYQNTLASIKLETEEQIMEKDKSDSEREEESQEEGGVKQEPSEELDPNEQMLYQNPDYNFFNVNYDTQLPIFEKRQEIVDAVNNNTVVIIQGTTGCGKTTQVPQYILDDHANRNMRCRIVVTQPRRIAATSVSKRVSAERNWPWGSVCGYKVSMDKRFNEDTRIFYVTTGYLLEYLVANDLELDNIYTHVILDEIHDRDINTDFLLLLLRILLLRKSKLKIILMSATLDPQPLIDYFQNFNNNAEIPLVECKMRTYTVKKWYLDKIQNVIEYEAKLEFDINLPEMHDEQLEVLVRLLDYIEKRELESLPADRETVNGFVDVRGATLIFVPGMEEILRVQDYLKTNRPNSGFVFCQLHSEIALDQQMQVFKRASPGQRKIIISTSIAESSITVPDVKFVVDFCLTKQTFTDEITNYTSLEMCWASKSNLEQRRGRAGRVENGIYYALVSEELYSRFSDFPDPAIYREPLDKVVLNAKRICKKMAPKNILSLCLSVPRLNDLERTVIKLKECGALTLYKRNTGDDGRVRMEMSMYDGNLTFSGEIMACLPVDTRLGKLIVMGHAFGRLKEAIIIAAGLSVRKLFSSFHQSKLEFYMGKFNYAKGLMCDFEAILTVYWLWKRKQAEWEQMTAGLGDKQRSEIRRLEREWAKSSMLDEKKLKDMQKIIDEIEHRLKSSFEIDVQESDYCNDNINREATDENSALDQYYIIKLMCAAAFYPNYFKTIHNDQMETEVMRQLCGKNPKTTIQVKGLEDPAIYHVRLKDIFKACGDKVIMHYDRSKAYVEFSDYYEVNERISSGVYFALFLGKMLRAEKLILPPARSAFHFERLLRIMRNTQVNNYEMTSSSRISSGTQSANEDADRHINDLKEFKMTIVQVESMNSFWAQVKEPEYLQTLESIHNTLNNKQYKLELHSREEVYIGMLVVSLFMSENDSAFYRAKVISTTREYVEVIFIDYGNIERKDYTLIYKMTDELKKIPSQAIQCSLAFARPNPFLSDAEKEKKLDDTILYLDRIRNLKAKVYSVVHNVVRVILINMDHPLYEFDILTDLVKLKLYERCEESRISKENNEHRMQSSLLIPRDSHNRSKNEWIHLENLDNILKDVEYDENAPMSRWHHFTVTSPVQTCLEGMTRAARNTQIKPDNASINAIILDDNPSLRCSSLLISYKIDINTQTRACRLRESTLFPKINGIVSLCLLAFSPQVELRYSKKTRGYTGALCGLGFDRIEKKPMYVENDIEDTFDTVITNNDIKDINTIRYQLNLLMGNKRTSMGIIQKPTVLKEYQQHLRGLCLKVLKETRETMNETITFEYPHRWNKIPEHHYNPLTVLQKQEFEMRKRNRIFYEPIRTVDFTKINQ